MAAILEPRLTPAPVRPARPPLRVVPGGDGPRAPRAPRSSRAVVSPVRPSVSTAHPVTISAQQAATALAVVIVALLVVVGAVAIGRGALAGLAPAGPSGVPVAATGPTTTVQVEVGDTMWSIARDLRPSGDVRPLVDDLVRLNGSATIVPGQELVVPAG